MIGRRRGPGLIGMAARTAVVAGTASAVAGGVQHRQQERYAADAQAQQPEQAAAPAPADTGSQYDEIERLGKLKDQGYITDEEFNAKKQQILGL